MSTRTNVIAHTLGSHGPVPADRLKAVAVIAMNVLLCGALASYLGLRVFRLEAAVSPAVFQAETLEAVSLALRWTLASLVSSVLPGLVLLSGRHRLAGASALVSPVVALLALAAGHTTFLLPGGLGLAAAVFLFRTRTDA